MSNYHKNLFEEANEFILPQTELWDYFDYLAGYKIELPEQKS